MYLIELLFIKLEKVKGNTKNQYSFSFVPMEVCISNTNILNKWVRPCVIDWEAIQFNHKTVLKWFWYFLKAEISVNHNLLTRCALHVRQSLVRFYGYEALNIGKFICLFSLLAECMNYGRHQLTLKNNWTKNETQLGFFNTERTSWEFGCRYKEAKRWNKTEI